MVLVGRPYTFKAVKGIQQEILYSYISWLYILLPRLLTVFYDSLFKNKPSALFS